MPQLTDRFGPIPSSIVLDGSGNGQLTFQANGSNARVTNLYVNVATSVAQATCTIYKGQVAPSNIIDSTNSGSTGASAKGAIDLMDGETLFVVWRGGDAGARAYATFTGVVVPFSQIGPSSITWADPIAAGDGSLIYPQIKSPDFVTGVSGWAIFRDGSVEFNDAVIRGSLEAGGGAVRLDASGLHIDGVGTQYDINGTAGFLSRNSPDDGRLVQIQSDTIFLSPKNPSPLGSTVNDGYMTVGYDNAGAANEAPNMVISSPLYPAKSSAFIGMRGQAANDANPDNTTNIDLIADNINLLVGATRSGFFKGEVAGFLLSFGPAASANVAVTYAKTYTNPPFPYANIDSGAGATALCVARCTARTNTGFNILIFSTDATNRTFVNVPISWATFEI